MKKTALLLLPLLGTGCNDEMPSSPSAGEPHARPRGTKFITPTHIPRADPNKALQPMKWPDSAPYPRPVITRSFDAVVLKKYERGLLVQGLSGKEYLLIPTQRFVERVPGEMGNINFDQVRAKDTLIVYLGARVPFVNAYMCEWADLLNAKLKDGRVLRAPPGIRSDE